MGCAIKDQLSPHRRPWIPQQSQLLLPLVGECLGQHYRKLAVLDQPHANSVISNSRSHAQETSNFLKRRPPKA